jgi:hypothetical protein
LVVVDVGVGEEQVALGVVAAGFAAAVTVSPLWPTPALVTVTVKSCEPPGESVTDDGETATASGEV